MSTPHTDHARDAITDSLAAYRLTRLASKDVILDRPRAWIIKNAYTWRDGSILPERAGKRPSEWQDLAESDPDAPKLAELVVCRWCVGAYISVGVVLARRYHPRLWEPVARALALSAAAALIAGLEDG